MESWYNFWFGKPTIRSITYTSTIVDGFGKTGEKYTHGALLKEYPGGKRLVQYIYRDRESFEGHPITVKLKCWEKGGDLE